MCLVITQIQLASLNGITLKTTLYANDVIKQLTTFTDINCESIISRKKKITSA